MQKHTLIKEINKIQTLHGHDGYLTSDDAASYLGISLSTLYKHTSAGNISYFKPNGKLILFIKSDLDAWVQKKRIPSNEELNLLTSKITLP